MSTLSKVLLGFVALAALCYIYVAARTLRTQEVWRQAVKLHEAKLAETVASVEKIQSGDPAAADPGQKKSLLAVKTELYSAISGRGRVWRDCTPRVDPASGDARVVTPFPMPNGIKVNDLLYVFEGTDVAAGRYIGEFKVAQAAAQEVLLQPSLKPNAAELPLLARSRGPWTLYEVMPADGADVFAGLTTPEQLQPFMPKPPRQQPGETAEQFQARQLAYNAIVQEYFKDGKPPAEDDPPERIRVVVKFNKDYEQLPAPARAAIDQFKVSKELVKEGSQMTLDKATADEFVKAEAAQESERRYERRWRDYAFYLREMARLLPIMQDRVAAETKNNQYMNAAVTDAKTHVTFTNDEIAVMKTERDRLKEEAAAVSMNLQSLTEKLQTAQAEIEKLRASNVQLARELGERQRANLQRAGQTAARTPAVAAN